ncbi:MAG: hypothetical protein LBC95_00390 [Candidatus Nomurabacteria bacterium]|jgi:hypothetical protein|nr:hypothetical protein [Candidatus Nomurabacteria bacterium]
MKYQTGAFCGYGLMKHYVSVVERYFTDAKKILGDKMLMYMLTSSCSLNACIDGWSDIDILIVTENLDFTELKALHSAQRQYDIKIALALLSRHELANAMFDDKTNLVFYQIAQGLSAPNFIVDNPPLVLPRVELAQIQQDDIRMLPMYLHKLRRFLYTPTNDKRAIIKMLYIVVKMRLRSSGHEFIAMSYPEAFVKFADEFNEELFDIVSEMLSNNTNTPSNEFVVYARRIVERICNGEI